MSKRETKTALMATREGIWLGPMPREIAVSIGFTIDSIFLRGVGFAVTGINVMATQEQLDKWAKEVFLREARKHLSELQAFIREQDEKATPPVETSG